MALSAPPRLSQRLRSGGLQAAIFAFDFAFLSRALQKGKGWRPEGRRYE